MRRNKGLTLVEILLASAIFSMMFLIIVRLYVQTQKSIRKSQELTNLQQLAKVSLEEIAREIRQTLEIRTTELGDIPEGVNFTLASDGSNQLCIKVPKLSKPGDKEIGDRIIYGIDIYDGKPNCLVHQLTTFTRNMAGDVIEDVSYSAIPIISDMDVYRANPGGTAYAPLTELFKNRCYTYDNMTFFWDYDDDPSDPRGVMALGLTVSVRDARGVVQNRLTLTTVVTSRPITGVPR